MDSTRKRDLLEQDARAAFLEIERIVLSHRASNTVPVLDSDALLEAAYLLNTTARVLSYNGWKDAPAIAPASTPQEV
ncbi:MAG TPA: hypothetical protein V6C88_19765 [Chroococcidiopsis sp.]